MHIHSKLVIKLTESPSFDITDQVIESAVNSALTKFLGTIGVAVIRWRVSSSGRDISPDNRQPFKKVIEFEIEVEGDKNDIALFRSAVTCMTSIANVKAAVDFR